MSTTYKNVSPTDHFDLRDDQYVKPSYLSELSQMFMSFGAGGYGNALQSYLVGFDKFCKTYVPANNEHTGYTFITRPRFNLSESGINSDTILAPLLTTDTSSMSFYLKCMLDTMYVRDNMDAALNSPLVCTENPFMYGPSNALKSFSGVPDPSVVTDTSEGGFQSDDITIIKGSDQLRKTYDLSIAFGDVHGGPFASLFFYWIYCSYLTVIGKMISYKEDIRNDKLNYTVSIYRFVTDCKRKSITKYSKMTGCFPLSVPMGSMFNINTRSDTYNAAAQEFSVPFKCNHVAINDPQIFLAFNQLVRRYCPEIEERETLSLHDSTIMNSPAASNYIGIPYVVEGENGTELVFKRSPEQESKIIYLPERESKQIQPSGTLMSDTEQLKTSSFA